jgi:glycosyltransferase involved in cell wall biosynthesis
MKTFSFVIPTFNHYNLLHQCLYDIYQKCSPVLEVIVVDDCSTDQEYHDGLKWWVGNGMLPIRVVRMKENSMFLKASNAGLKRAEGDIVCLLSNDVRIFKDIVAMELVVRSKEDKLLSGGIVYHGSTGWNEFDGRIFPYVEGWLLTTTNDGWRELEYFDEQFAPSDFEDVDLSTKAISLGYALGAHNDLAGDTVRHIGAQSIGYNSDREAITKINREKFRRKWLENEK